MVSVLKKCIILGDFIGMKSLNGFFDLSIKVVFEQKKLKNDGSKQKRDQNQTHN